jgi:hypothetical protein
VVVDLVSRVIQGKTCQQSQQNSSDKNKIRTECRLGCCDRVGTSPSLSTRFRSDVDRSKLRLSNSGQGAAIDVNQGACVGTAPGESGHRVRQIHQVSLSNIVKRCRPK